MKIVFIGCVKSKEDHKCEAKDLYISPLFEKSFAYANQLIEGGGKIFILSAKYHLVPLDKVISPYDLTLNDFNADEKREWTDKVIDMCNEVGIKQDDDITFLCGENYIHYLKEYFTNWNNPLEGLGLGDTLHWLDEHTKDKYKNKFSIVTMSLINRLKLAKMILRFGTIDTDKGELQYEGTLEEGLEVFIEENDELIPAPDGEYRTSDKIIVVEGGKISSITEIKTENEPPTEEEKPTEENEELEEENPTDPLPSEEGDRIAELEAKVTELEAIIAERDARIAELEAQLAEANEKLSLSVQKPAHVEIKETQTIKDKKNKALKFFQV